MSSTTTVLVVEDEPVTLAILQRYLAQAGFAVLTACNGEEALATLRARGHEIDWLFTDIELPGCIDGWIVGAEFHLSYPLRPVVYASTFAGRSEARAAGAIFLTKPFSPQEVVEIFHDLAGRGGGPPTSEVLALAVPDEPPAPEKRGAKRSRAMLRGVIIYNNRFNTLDCVVRNLSPSGARLDLAGSGTLPPHFELYLPLREKRYQAEIAWRRGEECGIRFIPQPVSGP